MIARWLHQRTGKCITRACVLALVPGAGWSAAAAQQVHSAQEPLTTLQLSTRLVTLDVVVTDSHGGVVTGLDRKDFSLLVDDKPQPIRNFDPPAPRAAEDATAPPASTAQPNFDRFGHADWGRTPLTLFVLDDLNTPFDEKSYAAFTLKRYLQGRPATLDIPASLLLVNDKGLHNLMPYTRDRNALIHALDTRPADVPDQLSKGQDLDLLTESFAVLRQIALSSEGSKAHKSLVWLGRGFPALDRTQLDDPGNAELEAGIRQVVTLLTEARIMLYKVDPITPNARAQATDLGAAIDAGASMGTAGMDAVSEDPLQGSFNFNSFATATGGQSFYGSNDLVSQIRESLDRGNEFYTLTYVPTDESERFHTFRVLLRNPALRATTRTGFYGLHEARAEPAAHAEAPVVDLQLAAMSALSYSGVSVAILQGQTSAAQGVLTVHFAVEDRTLTWTAAPEGARLTGTMRVLMVALDGDRRLQHSSAALLHLAVANRTAIAGGLVTTTQGVAIDAHTRSVRLLIQDASGRVGTADLDPKALQMVLQPQAASGPRR